VFIDMSRFRKGWFRLALVLSIAWIAAVVGYVAYESRLPAQQQSVFFNSSDENFSIDRYIDGKLQLPPHYTSHFCTSRFIGITVVPVAAMWLGVIVVFSAVSWICDGFKA
jgi:hypothetical protein